jgi:HSP20 family molecular chaperone IbpA
VVLLEDQDSDENELQPLFPTPFFSSVFDDLWSDRSFPSFSSIFDDMARTHDQFFSGFWNNDEVSFPRATGNKHVPDRSFLRGRSSLFLPQQQTQEYEIVDNDEKFQISFRLPEGMSLEDVRIELHDGGTRLVIHGEHHISKSNTEDGDSDKESNPAVNFQLLAGSSFTQSFSLDRSVQVDQFVATAKGGLLTVTAPKDDRKLKNLSHVIPIQDLDSIAASVGTSKSHVDSHRPHFLHKRLPFVESPTTRNQENEEMELGDEEQNVESLPDAKSITDGWREVSESSL